MHAFLQPLESRRLLAVSFSASAPIPPAVNTPDTALGILSNLRPIEPMVSVNPLDPTNLAVSSHRGLRISTDAGATFGPVITFPSPPTNNVFSGDTDTAFDSSGRLYWSILSGVTNRDIAVARLDPVTGATISTTNIQIDTTSDDDKDFIATDNSPASPYKDNVYCVWTRFGATTDVYFSRSTDLAVTWSAPLKLSSSATEGFVWPSDVAVAPNGDVYVAYHANGFGGSVGRTLVRRSTDGGVTFAAATQAFLAGQSDVTENVQHQPGTIFGARFWTEGAVQPWILPDPARPGNVYVVTNDDPDNLYSSGNDADVVLARSTDNGTTWTRWTIDSGPGNSFQLFPTAAIDHNGNIVVAWYDNRRGLTNGAGRYLLDIFATYSNDGGLTWCTPFMVNDSTNPFDPDPGAAQRFAGPPPTTRIGEYFGITLHDNTAYLAWNGNSFTGSTPSGQQVWFDSFSLAGTLNVTDVEDDDVHLRPLPANTNHLELLVNNQRQYTGLASGLTVSLSAQRLDNLTIDLPGAHVTVPATGQFLHLGNFSLQPTAALDLTDNDLIIHNADFTTIRALVLAGFGNSAGGITSSISNGSQILALFDNALVGAANFNGEPTPPNAIVGKYTYFADANLDGQVTGDDYTVIDANLNTNPPPGLAWLSGDMNLDTIITGDDYTVIDANLGLGVGNPLAQSSLKPAAHCSNLHMSHTAFPPGLTAPRTWEMNLFFRPLLPEID